MPDCREDRFLVMMRFALVGAIVLAVVGSLETRSSAHAAEPVDYARQVKPLLQQRCYACHGALKQQGTLRLDTGESMRRGGGSGPAVVAGQPAESLLLQAVRGEAGFRMPPAGEGKPLTPAEIALLSDWIRAGATTPADERPQEDPRDFWSYQPVVRPPLPSLREGTTGLGAIDQFLAAAQERQGLVPRDAAPRAVLLRRVYLDLAGIPPTRQELLEFLADERPDAYERVVERLLASPLHGERWGRHWMDVWRYSDWYGSRGINEIRYSQRHIWRWRDWIVESLNADRGYDQMLMEMLAGDELSPGDPQVQRATGFLGRNWYKFDRNVWMFETVEQTAQGFLGITLRCARCHDHKFDPIAQLDYYRLRAYFEPHDVRTDPASGNVDSEKDATLGKVLREGVSLVYDKQLDAPTYLFRRGDNRYPDTDHPLSAAVPPALGYEAPAIEAVTIPAQARFPALREVVVAERLALTRETAASAERTLADARAQLAESQWRLEEFIAHEAAGTLPAAAATGTLFRDDFSRPREAAWQPLNAGQWEYTAGKLHQKSVGHFPTLGLNLKHPRDFMARVRYRTLEAGAIHSVGVLFDMDQLLHAQAVYTATNNTNSTIQAFHRHGGVEEYPAAGVFPWPIKLGELITVDLAARNSLLNVWVNGELVIAYTMSMQRREGTFGLWTHSGSAEFHELLIDPLPESIRLVQSPSEKTRSPFATVTREDFARAVTLQRQRRAREEAGLAVARAELVSLEATLAVERGRFELETDAGEISPERRQQHDALARVAGAAERKLAAASQALALLQTQQQHALASDASYADDAARQKALADSSKPLEAATAALTAAEAAAKQDDPAYTQWGTIYPATSSGRRTALARWMIDRRNPRTARVAVNHIWLRHFGEALVPSVANFGLNGQRPSHPELLDWLAAELMEHGWSMKHMHRLMVTSAAYRRSTTDGAVTENHTRDPGNRYLWRMNSRRMEAEVVRDSVLALAGGLDTTQGGPELAELQGETSPRRSLYFRSTPQEKVLLLELFDQANPNECFRRTESVVPQQALALANGLLSMQNAERIADQILASLPRGPELTRAALIEAAFQTVLSRGPTAAEAEACSRQLAKSPPADGYPTSPNAVRRLVGVLLNYNDFVTIR